MAIKFHGQYNALTPTNTVLSNIAQFSVSFWFQTSGTVTSGAHIFGKGLSFQSLLAEIFYDAPFNIFQMLLIGAGGNGGERLSFLGNQPYFAVGTYDGTGGVSLSYLNSPVAGAPATVSGPCSTSTAALNFGLDVNIGVDAIIGKPYIYYSVLSSQNVLDLLRGNITEASLSPVWGATFSGTNGAAIQAGDAGLQNVGSLGTSAPYNLSSLNPILGNGTATYCPDLVFSPPVKTIFYGDTGDRLAGKSNVIVALNGNPAGTLPYALTAVDATKPPVIRKNTIAQSLNATTPCKWTDGDHTEPAVIYQLTEHFGPADVLDYTLPFGAYTTAQGQSDAVTTPTVMPNYCGQDAAGYFGVTGFGSPHPTMKVGVNLGGALFTFYNQYCATRNARYRCGGPIGIGGTVVTMDSADPTLPYSWTPGGTWYFNYWVTSIGNGIDGLGGPSPVGVHSMVFNDVNAGTTASPGTGHLAATLVTQSPNVCTVTLLGRTVIGTTVTISYDVEYKLDGNGQNITYGYDCNLIWEFTSTVGLWSSGNTISMTPGSDFWIFAPGDSSVTPGDGGNDRSDPLAMSKALHTHLTASNGNGPACLRMIEFISGDGSICNFKAPADLTKTTAFSWSVGNQGALNIVGIRALNTDPLKGPGPTGDGTYDHVSSKIYDSLLGFDGSDAVGNYLDFSLNHNTGGIAAAGCSSTDNGEFMDWGAGNNPNPWVVLEVTCASPHGLRPSDYVGTPNNASILPIAHPFYVPITGGDNSALSGTAAIGIVGTVSVTNGSATMTSSSSTSNLVAGITIQILGDATNTTYTVGGAGPTSWTISPVYAGVGTNSTATALTGHITLSVSQTIRIYNSGVLGQGLIFTDDTNGQAYEARSGSGTSYTLFPVYMGTASNASAIKNTAFANINGVSGLPAWPTSATSFIWTTGNTWGVTTGTKVQRVYQTVTLPSGTGSGTLTWSAITNSGVASYAFGARATAYWPGCKPWFPFQPYMSYACYDAIADETAPLLLNNAEVIFECGLEHWNEPGFPVGLINIAYGNLLKYLPGGQTTSDGLWTCASSSPVGVGRDAAYCLQSVRGWKRLQARYDTYGKGIKVIGLLGSQYGGASITATMINFCKTLGVAGVSGLQQQLEIGAVAHAPYTSATVPGGNINATWAAACNPSVGNWGAAEILAVYRICQKYNLNLWAYWSSQKSAIAGYVGPAMAGQVNGLPALYNYECAVASLDPNFSISLEHDLWYHPEMAYAFRTMLQSEQDGDFTDPGSGANLAALYAYQGWWGNGNPTNTQIWQLSVYGQQLGGNGASNLFTTTQVAKDSAQATGNGICNDHPNVSVILPQLQAWFGAANGVGPPPTIALTISPPRVKPNASTPVLLTLVGVGTMWTSGSTVTVTNSITGTTTVTKGTYTNISTTSATLTVTTGSGTGKWKITIDGTDSQVLAVSSGRPGWFTGLRFRVPSSA